MDWMGKRWLWYLISLLLIIPGLVSIGIRGFNYGIDYTGGNLIEIQFKQSVSVGQVRSQLDQLGLHGSSVREAGPNRFLLRTPELTEEKSKEVVDELQKAFGQADIARNEKVGATVGGELTRKALYALAIASVLQIIYITIRFEFYFAVAAILALLHDALVVAGVFSLFQVEIDGTFVAAILTILGYSINDTIVVFDRIRENLQISKRESQPSIVNKSISQTLFRSISTSSTVILILIALLTLGGTTTRVFALAMLIGTISGTYSSICVASPLWVDLQRLFGKTRQAAKAV